MGNPSRMNEQDQSTDVEGNMGYKYEHHEPGKTIGSRYKKALFFGYTDDTFTEKMDHPEHLGFLGPVIKGEVGETVEIFFMNKATRPYNMFPWGAVNKEDFIDEDHSVQPGEVKRYLWKIPESSRPQANQPRCISSIYVSAVDRVADVSTGLMGPLLICDEGGIDDPTVDHDFYLQFHEVDENLSHYFSDNVEIFLGEDPDMFEGDGDFEESNKMKAVNGLLWRTPGLEMFSGETIRWHLIGWGSEKDYHSVHFHGHTYTFINDGAHTGDVFEVYPGFLGTVTMRVEEVGTWLLHCHVFQHLEGGMEITYTVKSKDEVPAKHENRCYITSSGGQVVLSCQRMSIRTASDFVKYGIVVAITSNGELIPISADSVTTLDLSENLVSSQRHLREILRIFPNLRALDVSSNRLRSLGRQLFQYNQPLRSVTMRNNPRLMEVSLSLEDHIPFLSHVDLSGNPQLPDCFREAFHNANTNTGFSSCLRIKKGKMQRRKRIH